MRLKNPLSRVKLISEPRNEAFSLETSNYHKTVFSKLNMATSKNYPRIFASPFSPLKVETAGAEFIKKDFDSCKQAR